MFSKGIIDKCEHEIGEYISPIFYPTKTIWLQQINTEPEKIKS